MSAAAIPKVSMIGLTRAARRLSAPVGLALIPVVLLSVFLLTAFRAGRYESVDFHVFWLAARDYLHGRSPYPADIRALTWAHGAQFTYAYPPLVAVLAMPLTFLHYQTAAAVFVVGSAAAVPAALWLLGVRDWRCYGAAFLWPPVLSGVAIGTISPLLLLGVAACWRLRG